MLSAARRRERTGFVLILVLGMLVLISVLVIGFLGHAASQSKSVGSYRDQTGTLLLGDLTVNIIKSQIDTATSASATLGSGALWASQPGAIRTVSSNGNQTTYKLYSSSVLTDANTGSNLKTDILADLPPTADAGDWSGSALWTDLNAPTTKADGTNAYPIVDVINDATDLPAGATSTPPFTTGSFNIDSTPANNPIGATRVAGSTAWPLPMPVRWLYVLKQGQVIAPDSTSTATLLTFNSASTVPTSANPIIGRIAFWTDDDTCRVNINTASYGTFWDMPRFTSTDDLTLANDQPVNKEYQRYPGHAAMTTLTLALPEFAPGGVVSTASAEALHALSPRYYPGGSTEGTVASTTSSTALGATPKTNRLYASVDELLFDPPPTAAGTRTASSYLNKTQVETAKFFLTAHSRAPELNLFGEPRVAMWPLSTINDSNHRTATDQLIAFCATTPGTTPYAYYFTRAPFTYLGGQGNWVAGLAGSSACATTANPSTSDISIARNASLMGYLDALTATSLPGNLGGGSTYNSAGKYTQLGMRQILTEVFDYIRMTNARDPLLDPQIGGPSGGLPYSAYGSSDNNGAYNNFGNGQILPSVYNWPGGSQITYGYGRFSGNLVEASLVFVAVGQGVTTAVTPKVIGYPLLAPSATQNCTPVPQAQCATTYTGAAPAAPAATYTGALPYSTAAVTPVGSAPVGGVPPQGDTAVQAMLVLSFFDPALGYDLANANFSFTITGLGGTLNGTSLGFPAATSAEGVEVGPSADFYGYPNAAGSFLPWQSYLSGTQFKANTITSGNPHSAYMPFFSNIINVSNTVANMALAGLNSAVKINIYPENAVGSSRRTKSFTRAVAPGQRSITGRAT
jgi:uncharacterized protein (TIGR02600 family)